MLVSSLSRGSKAQSFKSAYGNRKVILQSIVKHCKNCIILISINYFCSTVSTFAQRYYSDELWCYQRFQSTALHNSSSFLMALYPSKHFATFLIIALYLLCYYDSTHLTFFRFPPIIDLHLCCCCVVIRKIGCSSVAVFGCFFFFFSVAANCKIAQYRTKVRLESYLFGLFCSKTYSESF